MIPIRKSQNNVPATLTSDDCIASLNQVWNGGVPNKEAIKNKFYAANDVRERLANLYNDKCAYCEGFDDEFEVEHYRPKAGITGVSRDAHPGYYWLAYEWTNLLPACHDCNKTRNKGNKFPIAHTGTRMVAPVTTGTPPVIDRHQNHFLSAPLAAEIALLIHPEEPNFDPFHYFKFDRTGKMLPACPKNSTDYLRAQTTIEDIAALNRSKLYDNYRKTELLEIYKDLVLLYFRYLKDKNIEALTDFYFGQLRKIKEKGRPIQKYSFFWAFLYKNIGLYINAFFKKNKSRELFHQLTAEFKAANP